VSYIIGVTAATGRTKGGEDVAKGKSMQKEKKKPKQKKTG
jgi:hypothetical protein